MLRSPYPSPSRRASSHEVECSSTHSTTESRSPRKSERPSSNVVAPLVARLVERVAAPAGSAPSSITVLGLAVDLPAVAAPADEEDALAPGAPPLPTDLRLDLVHRRSGGATLSCLSRRPRRRSPMSGTVMPLRPEGSGCYLGPLPFVTPRGPNLPAAPRRGPVRVGFPRISVTAYTPPSAVISNSVASA